MSVKLCGHILDWHKPIKVYTFFKRVVALAALSLVLTTPSFAADTSRTVKQASSESSVPCNIAPSRCVDLAQKGAPTDRTQRSAGTSSPSASAMALVLALGLRNVNGPLERSAPHGMGDNFKTMEE